MAEANLVDTDDGRLYTRSFSLSNNTNTSLTHNDVVSGKNITWMVKRIEVANYEPNAAPLDIQFNIEYYNGTNYRYIAYNQWVPYGTSLVITNESLPVYLQYGDAIRITNVVSQSSTTLDVKISYVRLQAPT